MIKRLSFLILITAANCLYAQERPSLVAQPNTLYVGADGKFESAPDTALVQFNISAQEETAKAAYDRASRNAEQIRQILRSNGIDPKTAEIGYFSLDPVFDYKNPKRKLLAYAYRRARMNGEAVARAGGRVLGNLSYASVDTFEPIPIVRGRLAQPMMMRAQSEAASPTAEFTPQSITVTAHVNALFELK